MKYVKQFTRSITALLYWPLAMVVIPLVLAMIGQVFGLWSWVDSILYTSNLQWFVLGMLVSRVLFGSIWIILAAALSIFGEDAGFFWFRPESTTPNVDRSGEVMKMAAGIVGILIWSELMIRIVVGTAPYLR